MVLRLLFILIFSTEFAYSETTLPLLVNELLQQNYTIKENNITSELSRFDFQAYEASKPFTLSLYGENADSGLENAPLYVASPYTSKTYSLSLSKSLFTGTTFSLENSLYSIERESVAAVFIGTVGETHLFSQTLSLSQDLGKNFLGRLDRNALALAKDNYDLSVIMRKKVNQDLVINFLSHYYRARYNKTILSLQEEAFSRAQKLTRLTKKKVRDGLRERVDLYQAQASELNQKEAVDTAKNELNMTLAELAKMLHREVPSNEISPYKLEGGWKFLIPKGNVNQNLEIDSLEKAKSISRKELYDAERSKVPTVTLDASYGTNDYDSVRSTVFEKGRLGNTNNEKKISLNVYMPLGFETEKIEISKKRALHNKNIYKLSKLKLNNLEVEKSLKERLINLKRSIESANKRVDLSLKALKEYNRLYNRGRADLDRVISSEEALIQVQRSLSVYLLDRDNLISKLNLLYGDLIESLTYEEAH